MSGTHGRKFEPVRVSDDEVLYFMEETIEAARSIRRDPMGSDDGDTVTVCLVCNDVEGHIDGCPITTLDKIVQLSRRRK